MSCLCFKLRVHSCERVRSEKREINKNKVVLIVARLEGQQRNNWEGINVSEPFFDTNIQQNCSIVPMIVNSQKSTSTSYKKVQFFMLII